LFDRHILASAPIDNPPLQSVKIILSIASGMPGVNIDYCGRIEHLTSFALTIQIFIHYARHLLKLRGKARKAATLSLSARG
jgi:hypothetical protein